MARPVANLERFATQIHRQKAGWAGAYPRKMPPGPGKWGSLVERPTHCVQSRIYRGRTGWRSAQARRTKHRPAHLLRRCPGRSGGARRADGGERFTGGQIHAEMLPAQAQYPKNHRAQDRSACRPQEVVKVPRNGLLSDLVLLYRRAPFLMQVNRPGFPGGSKWRSASEISDA